MSSQRAHLASMLPHRHPRTKASAARHQTPAHTWTCTTTRNPIYAAQISQPTVWSKFSSSIGSAPASIGAWARSCPKSNATQPAQPLQCWHAARCPTAIKLFEGRPGCRRNAGAAATARQLHVAQVKHRGQHGQPCQHQHQQAPKKAQHHEGQRQSHHYHRNF